MVSTSDVFCKCNECGEFLRARLCVVSFDSKELRCPTCGSPVVCDYKGAAVYDASPVREEQTDAAQVTNYDEAEVILSAWLDAIDGFPLTPDILAYKKAVLVIDKLVAWVDRFEKSAAYKRIAGAQ